MAKKFDAIIIGAGQAGSPLAHNLADRGWQVALIEREHLGGSCINYGCTPTKKMIASAKAAYEARRAAQFGIRVGPVEVDLPKITVLRDQLVLSMREGQETRVSSRPNITLIRGEASFSAPYQVEVNGQRLHSQQIFINTGSSAAVPKIPGIDQVEYLDNRSILNLRTVPEHLIVVGASYIGLEYGQMFRRFGSQVTIVATTGQIAPQEDRDVAASLQSALEKENINFLLSSQIQKVEKHSTGGVQVTVKCPDPSRLEILQGTHLLVATGRQPNSAALNLEAAGIEHERGWIKVNDRLETNQPGIYAMGDVNGGPAFTHISYNDFQIILNNLFEPQTQSTRGRLNLYTLYTDPELGRVGLSEREARAAGYQIKVGTMPMNAVARAIERIETEGLMKVVIDANSNRILGATVLAANGGELVQSLMILMLADAPWTLLKGAVYIHPTLTEGFFGLMENVK